MGKRLVLFLAVNLAVIVTISITFSILSRVFGLQPYMHRTGINYTSLAVFCLVWGFGGAFISLALSRVMAKWTMGVKPIDVHTGDPRLAGLVTTVHDLARRAGITRMPEVGIYDSPEVNAFATGPTRNRSLVAVSTGLLQRMRSDEVAGVLGHEIAHVANGDMVTMTLVQGVINAFVMFFARVIAYAIGQTIRDDDARYWARFAITMVLEIVLSFLGFMVVAWFSRWREFRADAGGAQLAGRDRMAGALRALARNVDMVDRQAGALATLKISGGGRGLMALFSTHPPLEVRIRRVEST
jgi:heat shock protein HtpX